MVLHIRRLRPDVIMLVTTRRAVTVIINTGRMIIEAFFDAADPNNCNRPPGQHLANAAAVCETADEDLKPRPARKDHRRSSSIRTRWIPCAA